MMVGRYDGLDLLGVARKEDAPRERQQRRYVDEAYLAGFIEYDQVKRRRLFERRV
jgi:hypothetical protein